mgnify:CR=1 FL=1
MPCQRKGAEVNPPRLHFRETVRRSCTLTSLSVTRFVYKRLNIIFAGYAQCFSSPGKGGLRFSDSCSGGVADNNLSILLLEEQDLSPDFSPSCRLISTGTVI